MEVRPSALTLLAVVALSIIVWLSTWPLQQQARPRVAELGPEAPPVVDREHEEQDVHPLLSTTSQEPLQLATQSHDQPPAIVTSPAVRAWVVLYGHVVAPPGVPLPRDCEVLAHAGHAPAVRCPVDNTGVFSARVQAGRWSLQAVAADGYSSRVVSVQLDQSLGPDNEVLLELAQVWTVVGRLVDTRGSPLVDWPVTLSEVNRTADQQEAPSRNHTVQTGPQGTFHFESRRHMVCVLHAGTPQHPLGPSLTAELELDSSSTRLVLEATQVAELELWASSDLGAVPESTLVSLIPPEGMGPRRVLHLDLQARASLQGVPVGRWSVTAETAVGVALSQQLELHEGLNRVQVRLSERQHGSR
jgi:hypothetical protein